MEFIDWIRKRGYGKYLDFSYSMTSVVTGLLWGAETFLLFVFLSFVAVVLIINRLHCEWFIAAVVLVLITFVLFKADKIRADKFENDLREAFEETRWEVPRLEEDLMQFKRLLEAGVITEEEYKVQKDDIRRKLKGVLNREETKTGQKS